MIGVYPRSYRDVTSGWLIAHSEAQGDCMVYYGSRNKHGYCRIQVGGRKGRKFLVHRLMWILVHGIIPDEICVLHKCDNPPCINPEHLFLGTRRENSADMVRKDRQSRHHYFGERSSHHKLTWVKVLQIRKIGRGMALRELADIFGVCQDTISSIRAHDTWKEDE
jgi:HNH endonuclease